MLNFFSKILEPQTIIPKLKYCKLRSWTRSRHYTFVVCENILKGGRMKKVAKRIRNFRDRNKSKKPVKQ